MGGIIVFLLYHKIKDLLGLKQDHLKQFFITAHAFLNLLFSLKKPQSIDFFNFWELPKVASYYQHI